ncbi:hypothetical protein BCD72_002722 [Clostridium butyricum]|nr:hypothetical protein [Clostridium butyricum]MBA8972762.1 hypothetical protein [Clostridium butyricum]NOW38176.1 hypothetical protein [Clostridium butyricum]
MIKRTNRLVIANAVEIEEDSALILEVKREFR